MGHLGERKSQATAAACCLAPLALIVSAASSVFEILNLLLHSLYVAHPRSWLFSSLAFYLSSESRHYYMGIFWQCAKLHLVKVKAATHVSV